MHCGSSIHFNHILLIGIFMSIDLWCLIFCLCDTYWLLDKRFFFFCSLPSFFSLFFWICCYRYKCVLMSVSIELWWVMMGFHFDSFRILDITCRIWCGIISLNEFRVPCYRKAIECSCHKKRDNLWDSSCEKLEQRFKRKMN